MATLAHFSLLFIFLFVLHGTRGKPTCDSMSCGEIDVRFPFGLKGANQDPRCSYPRFQLSCDNHSQAILTLPHSGDLVVKRINYEDQTIQVNDPDQCLPKRFLQNLSFSGSPFTVDATVYGLFNLTFLRCPSNVTESFPLPLAPISCLSDPSSHPNSSSVIVSWARPIVSSPLSERCEVISSELVPLPSMDMPMWPFWPDPTSDVGLTWTEPRCGGCATSGQVCGFAMDAGLRVGCFSGPPTESQGLPSTVKYGLAIGVGIPGLLCIIGLFWSVCCKVTRGRGPSTELPTTTALEPTLFIMGLDSATIEKYPKTRLGNSGRLSKPNDNTCSICLSEYEPRETLRSIPECNHYFHAHCIDEWLKMNATCPLCRNSPDASSTVSPSFSSLSHSSSLSSSP